MKYAMAIVALAVLFVQTTAKGQAPPAAPVDPVTDDYFGIKVVDPYRYLENLADPRTKTWMKAQADYTRTTLDHLPSRAEWLADIEKYVNAAPASVSEVRRLAGGRVFFLKTLAGQSLAKLYMRQDVSGSDVLLVDSDRFIGPHGEPPAINYYEPSPDGRYVAFGISVGGSEEATLHVVDVDSGQILPEEIDREQFGAVQWRADNHSFFYCRLQKLAANTSPLEKYQRSQNFLHVLGTPVEQDVDVFGIDVSPLVQLDPVEDGWITTSPGSKYAVGTVENGTKLEWTIYSAPIETIGVGQTPWAKVCDFSAQVTNCAVHGDDLYLLTHDDAPRFKIVRTSLSHPDMDHAEVIVPQGPCVLRDLTAASDALYVTQINDGVYEVVRVPYGGTPAKIALPFKGDATVYPADGRALGVLIDLAGWTKGGRILQFDPQSGKTQPTDLQPSGPYDNLDELTSVEEKVPSYDGALVPLSIVYKKGLVLDGRNPTIIMAYGGYGITLDPYLSPAMLAWMMRGGVYAVAHVRGGGEKGEDWHQGAYHLTKPNVWRDLIACSQYMIEQKYASPKCLAIYGGSNGGITMGRALTARPDLYAAVAIRSGLMNAVRFEHDPNGPGNVPEFGSASTQEGFEDLMAMDAYHHVRDGVAYPAVLLTTGMNDPRVQPWSPAKMAARLQAATSSGKPILLDIDYQGGHGIGMSKKQRNDLYADMFSFFLWQFGQN